MTRLDSFLAAVKEQSTAYLAGHITADLRGMLVISVDENGSNGRGLWIHSPHDYDMSTLADLRCALRIALAKMDETIKDRLASLAVDEEKR